MKAAAFNTAVLPRYLSAAMEKDHLAKTESLFNEKYMNFIASRAHTARKIPYESRVRYHF